MISLNANLLKPTLGKNDYSSIRKTVRQAQKALIEKTCPGREMLGWMDLPVRASDAELDEILSRAQSMQQTAPYLVLVGIGGSYLGSRAALEFLQPEWNTDSNLPRILYFGHHLSSDYAAGLMRFLQDKDYAVCVISKSGSTTETAVAFRLLRQQMAEKYSPAEMKRRITIITEKKPSSLRQLCDYEKYPNLIHPDDVGGRFSVLSAVGLFPMAVRGIDIKELLAGAQAVRQQCVQEQDLFANLALFYAASRYLLYKKGKKIEVLSAFESSFPFMAEWWKQLFGESEGKQRKGLFPASTLLTTDLHSLGQYIQDGERKLFETFLRLDQPDHTIALQPFKPDLDQLNYLKRAQLHAINQKAYEGTALAHHQGDVPSMTITLSRRSAFDLGQLFYFFQFSVAVSGLLLKVNPFDQPGVEDYKNNMFALLGKPGYEKLKKKTENGLKQLNNDGWMRLGL